MKINPATEVSVQQKIPERPVAAAIAQGEPAVAVNVVAPATMSTGKAQAGNSVAPTSQIPSGEELKRKVEELQQRVNAVAPELEFSIDESSGRSIVKVTDRTTKDVILQIPSEETLKLNKELDRFQQGFLLNRKA